MAKDNLIYSKFNVFMTCSFSSIVNSDNFSIAQLTLFGKYFAWFVGLVSLIIYVIEYKLFDQFVVSHVEKNFSSAVLPEAPNLQFGFFSFFLSNKFSYTKTSIIF